VEDETSYVALDVGSSTICAIRDDDDGTLDCWGTLAAGAPATAAQVSVGNYLACALDGDGAPTCWPALEESGCDPDASTPMEDVWDENDRFVGIAAGRCHVCAQGLDGVVSCWGDDSRGQLQDVPSESMVQVDAGYRTTCALDADGSISCWGDDTLGQGSPPGLFRAVAAGGHGGCALIDSRLQCWGDRPSEPALQLDLVELSGAGNATCGLTASGTPTCWGEQGLVEDDVPAGSGYTSLDAGWKHVCALDGAGEVVCWSGLDGERTIPNVGGLSCQSFDVTDEGSVITIEACLSPPTGGDEFAPPDGFEAPDDVLAGFYTTCGLVDGQIDCWGLWEIEEARDEDFIAVSGADFLTCGVRSDQSAVCWLPFEVAYSYYGFPISDPSLPSSGTLEVELDDPIEDVVSSIFSTCAIGAASSETPGRLRCWVHDLGCVGTDAALTAFLDDEPITGCADEAATFPFLSDKNPDEPPDDYVDIDMGNYHLCGLRSDGAVDCWIEPLIEGGYYDHGQAEAPAGTFTSVTTGSFHTCGVRADGETVCWGRNDTGQSSPFDPGEFTELTLGESHHCAIWDGRAVCAGDDEQGQASEPEPDVFFDRLDAGDDNTCGVLETTGLSCWGDDTHGQSSPPEGTGFQELSVGRAHGCALAEDGSVACWGDIDAVPSESDFVTLCAGAHHACALGGDGIVSCWGANDNGQSDAPTTVFEDVTCGAHHTCGRVAGDGPDAVECWGRDVERQTTDTPAHLFNMIDAGEDHTCGLKEDGLLACWGRAVSGESDVPTP
ncbi:MAG: alpha-tubulin suppressor-like RCC1 family protein, partial [Myxococcota bacterium]